MTSVLILLSEIERRNALCPWPDCYRDVTSHGHTDGCPVAAALSQAEVTDDR